jgi:hypothetical protein
MVEEIFSQGVRRVGIFQIIKYFREGRKECMWDSIESFCLQQRSRSGRIGTLRSSKGRWGLSYQAQKSGRQVIWQGVIEILNGWWNFSEGEVSISVNRCIQWSCREVKGESPSTFARSGDIASVRYKGMRVIILSLEF